MCIQTLGDSGVPDSADDTAGYSGSGHCLNSIVPVTSSSDHVSAGAMPISTLQLSL